MWVSPSPDPNPRRPALAAPPGACDCHFHVFGPIREFPYLPGRSYTPPEASVEAYRRVMTALGIERCVIIQPSVYGTDNACTLAAMARLGPGCHGVAVLGDEVTEAELESMNAAGMRGVRFNLLYEGGPGLGPLTRVAERIAPFGWHVQLLIDGRGLPEMRPSLDALPVPIVVDHMGHIPAAAGVDHPGNRALIRLAREGRCWVKLSGAYYLSDAWPRYADVAPLARALIAAAPERMVWGTDWPHPAARGKVPNDGDVMDLLADWTDGDAALRRRVLVDNPARLYGF